MATQQQRITTPEDPLETAVRKLLKELMKQSRKSRATIADEMTPHSGRKISKRMIDDWTSPKMRARFPASLIEAFCEAIGNDTLQRHVMGARLHGIVDLREEQLAWLRTQLLKPRSRRKAQSKPPRKS